MKSSVRRLTVPLAIGLAVLAGPAMLTGCSIQNLVHNATGGKVDLGGKEIPKDFPSEVPIAKGEVLYGLSVGDSGGKVWNLTIRVDGASSFDDIAKQLTDAGFKSDAAVQASTADGGTGVFASDKLGVIAAVTKDGKNGWVANYTVSTVKDKGK
ncbi:hypothetical protein [Lacisediminihabitans profunda]|uniref:Lipoprotein n=1 Tax=Lacisediminihabitans profunda TaxID=2594790 RepID=A0A5C8UUD4_9MICO|nr:hypothetical protein [Lacisediminihabitans profunda]TXN31199.1 hypothetical protein FVP33_06380 [Lacisediminihabitans profunda]